MLGQPTTGSLLSRTFALFGAGAVPFLTIVTLVQSPWIVYYLFSGTLASPVLSLTDSAVNLVSTLILGPLGSAALVFGVFRSLRGQSVTVGECFRVGFSRLLPVLFASILIGLAVIGGVLLCLIPGIVVACGLFISIPALVVEELSPIEAMRRSWELTQGSKVPVFLISLLLALPGLFVGFMSGLTLDGSSGTPWMWAGLPVTIFVGTLQGIAMGVTYHDIRLFREGLGEDELAAVFD